MNKEEILNNIRLERPDQVINKIISIEKNNYGFYNVKVDMEGHFFETTISSIKITLPYPNSEYLKLSKEEKFKWRINFI